MKASRRSGAFSRESDRALCQLIHDARNHLNAVSGLGLLLGDTSTHPNAGMYRDCLRSEAQQLGELLESIHANLSGHGDLLPHVECFDPVENLRLIACANQPLAERAGILLVLDAPDQLPRLKGMPSLLNRMLTNLVFNAIKHSRATLVHLTVAAAPLPCATRSRLSYRVSDNGVGLCPTRSHGRTPNAATPVTQKNGHGLSICRKLASDLGATFELSDAVPGGLTARIDVTVDHAGGMPS